MVGWLIGWLVGWVCMHARKYNITCADAPRHPTPHTCTYPMKNSRQDCVQDLMQCAVTCASPALYASLRLFLQARPSALCLSLLLKYKQRKNEGETRRRTSSSTLTHPKLNQPLPTTHTRTKHRRSTPTNGCGRSTPCSSASTTPSSGGASLHFCV